MIRAAIVAATLLLGTAAEAKPYKVTITGSYNNYFEGGKTGLMTFEAIINDPPVVTTSLPDEADCLYTSGCNRWNSGTSFSAYFNTKVDGIAAANSFMDLNLDWSTFDADEGYGLSHFKYLDVTFNSLSLPALAAIANPSIDKICQTAFQPTGPCLSVDVSSELVTYYDQLIGIGGVVGTEDATKDILNFSIGEDRDYSSDGVFAEVSWNAKPPAGYSGDAATSGVNIVDFTALSFAISPVPEPTSWAILIMGFSLVGAASRRRVRALSHA